MRLLKPTSCAITMLLVCFAPFALAQGNRGTAEVTIKGKKISIDYGRPNWGGEDRLAQLPVGGVWRLGMNMATVIDSAADLTVSGKPLKAGKYSLWVKRTGDKTFILAFHPKTGIWGVPEMKEGYVAELPLKLETASAAADQLSISLAEAKGQAMIKIHWGTSQLTGSFGVS